jgi:probable HAF family extracellular repeat protein
MLPGDAGSFASAINSRGQVVGSSFDATGNIRAFIWQNGTMTDLNTLTAADSSLFLLEAAGINSRGQIVGQALQTSSGELHAFLATPRDGEVASASARAASRATGQRPVVVVPENVRQLLWQRLTFSRFGLRW